MSGKLIVLFFLLLMSHYGEGRTSSTTSSLTGWRYYLVNHGCIDYPYCETTTEEGFCRFTPWTEWTECTGCAPMAEKNRSRTCLTDTCESGLCHTGPTKQVWPCRDHDFPCCEGYPKWTEWSNWLIPCGKLCGQKQQTRRRDCLPCKSKLECYGLSGSFYGEEDCPDPCPPKCIRKTKWESWSHWSNCERDPANPLKGLKTRERECSTEDCGDGRPCEGEWKETTYCDETDCYGYWNSWSSWSSCATTCNIFMDRTRYRTCKASPRCGDSRCKGQFLEKKHCISPCCRYNIEPYWTKWTRWSDCTRSCGQGTQTRSRKCKGSKECLAVSTCLGESKEQRICFTWCCKDMKLGKWGPWSSCSSTCGGTSTRKRKCKARKCEHKKEQCATMKKETKDCPKSDDPSCDSK